MTLSKSSAKEANFTLRKAQELLERVVDRLAGIEAVMLAAGDDERAIVVLRLNLAKIKAVFRAINVIQAVEEVHSSTVTFGGAL